MLLRTRVVGSQDVDVDLWTGPSSSLQSSLSRNSEPGREGGGKERGRRDGRRMFQRIREKNTKVSSTCDFFYLGFIINMKRKSALFGFAKII